MHRMITRCYSPDYEIAQLKNVLEGAEKQIDSLRDSMLLEQCRKAQAVSLLRQLFYHRHPIGTKVEDAISEENPELWCQCYQLLNQK
jgi:hypothetical protein